MTDDGKPEDASTLHRPRFERADTTAGAFALIAIEGPDKGARFVLDPLTPSPILVGQGQACAVRLTDREVSRRHISIDASGSKLRITDLGSTNGTFVDGVSIVEAFLAPESIVRIGSTALQVERVTIPKTGEPSSSSATSFGRTIGASLEMRRLYLVCERLAQSTASVIIEGETGTGKEVLAESIHEMGPRAGGPFVVFDCAASAGDHADADLFGNEAGDKRGALEQANRGTLLLDEISELDPRLQAKLLRALERSEIQRASGARAPVDVRVVVATRRDLDREIQRGRFREDLFHLLAVARVELPPLRRRRGDVEFLARHICRELSGDERAITAEQLTRWQDYPWPANVRELRRAVLRDLALGDLARESMDTVSTPIADEDNETVAQYVMHGISQGMPLSRARQQVINVFDRLYIDAILKKHNGSVIRAAGAAGVARRYFQILKARQKA